MYLSSVWPRGIEILLQHSGISLVNRPLRDSKISQNHWLPMSYALENCNFEALKLLLDAGSALSSLSWTTVWFPIPTHEELLCRALRTRDLRFISVAVEALLDRRTQLYDMAMEMLPGDVWTYLDVPGDRVLNKDAVQVQNALLDFGIKIPQALQVNQTVNTVYNGFGSPLVTALPGDGTFESVFQETFITEAADSLFNSGFRDIDISDERGLTPLGFNVSTGGTQETDWPSYLGLVPKELAFTTISRDTINLDWSPVLQVYT